MSTPRPLVPFRWVGFLLAIALASPAVQWCRYSWSEVPAECLAGCALSTSSSECPASGGSCASESGCGAANGASPANETDSDHAGGAAGHEGRAWCPHSFVGSRPSSSPDADFFAPVAIAAIVAGLPDPTCRPRPMALAAIATPAGNEERLRPPVRAPPAI